MTTCSSSSPLSGRCTADATLAVRTTASRNQGLKTLIYWDHTDAPKVAQVLCAEHGARLIKDLATTLVH